jgi:hypothetical protein
MRQTLQFAGIVTAVFVLALARGMAQNAPAVTDPDAVSPGFSLPKVGGTLHYAVSVSERISPDYNNTSSTAYFTNLSGEMGYLSASMTHPFSMIYSGGFLGTNSGQPSSTFHNLTLSQLYNTKNWKFVATDSVDYLPTAPVAGLSGIPGLGDIGVIPGGSTDGSGLLSNYSPRVTNKVSGSATRQLTGRTGVSGSGTYDIQRFVGDVNGLENNQLTATTQVIHDFGPRTQMAFNYSYAKQTYLLYNLAYNSNGVTVEFERQWTRKFKTDASAGPQYTVTPGVAGAINYTVNGSADYQVLNGSYDATFIRSVNTGSGVTLATRSNTARLNATHRYGRYTDASVFVSYLDSHTLSALFGTPTAIQTFVGSFQVTRSITPRVSAYISYSAQNQTTTSNAFTQNSLNGLTHTIGFGISYTPKPITIGR